MKLLVTGATGLVGSHVVEEALSRGHEVRCLSRPSSDRVALAGLDAEVVWGDALDPGSLVAAARGCEAVFHVAGIYDPSAGGAERMWRLHREGTRNVVLAARAAGVARVVLTSSSITCAFGPPERPGTVDEDPEPGAAAFRGALRAYYESKREGEAIALAAAARGEVEAVVVNPCFVLGARDPKPTSGALVLRVARARLPLVPPGGNTFVTARDCARGHLGALTRGVSGRRYLLGAWPLSYREVAEEVLARTERRARPVAIPGVALRAGARVVEAALGVAPGLGRWVEPYTLAQLGKFRAWREPELEGLLGGAAEPIGAGIGEALEWFAAHGRLRRGG